MESVRLLQSEIHSNYSTVSGDWAVYNTKIFDLFSATGYNASGNATFQDFSDHLVREYNTKIAKLGMPTGLFFAPYDAGYRLVSNTLTPLTTPFSPLSLFSAGEQGVWYDPSDLTTMFEDSAGLTPVHTPGNGVADSPVALLFDKHSGAVGTNGAYSYNKLLYTEEFNNAYWTTEQASIGVNQTLAPNDTLTADSLQESVTNSRHIVYRNTSVSSGNNTFSVAAKANTRSFLALSLNTGGPAFTAIFDLTNGTVTTTRNNSATGTGASITDLGNGWYRCAIRRDFASGVTTDCVICLSNTGTPTSWIYDTPTYQGDGSSNLFIWGAQIALTSAPSTYQKITSNWVATIAGNHATQSTSTARPSLSARYNLLIATENLSSWQKYTATVTGNTTTDPNGLLTADTLTASAGSGAHNVQQQVTSPSNTQLTISIACKYNNNQWIAVSTYDSSWKSALFDVQNGVLGTAVSAGVSRSITSLGNGWYRCSITYTSVAANAYLSVHLRQSDTLSDTFTATGTEAVYLWGADLRVTNDGVNLPSYQRVVDANTYDSVGFPYYLKFDGVDDCLLTSSIDFTGTNKVTVFGGIRKLSDSAQAIVVELGPTVVSTNGTFALTAPNSVGANLNFSSRGTTTVDNTVTTYTSPITTVITAIGDISAPNNQIRINKAVAGTSTSSQGTGNYSNSSLYLMRRNNASSPFNGRIFSIIVRGASSTSTEINNTETWINGVAKIY